jgi:hypothetical protein
MTPREKGVQAFQQGISQLDNPFVRYSHDWDLWKEGWMDAWHDVLLHEISSRASKPTLFIEVEKEKQQMDLFDSFKPWPWPL